MRPAHLSLVRRRLSVLLAIASSVVVSVCADPGTGPGSGSRARIAFAPQFSAASELALQTTTADINNVRLIIRRGDGTIVLDTVVVFPPGASELQIAADVPVNGASEPFRVTFQLRADDEVLFEGTQEFVARPGTVSSPTTTLPVTYVGPGADAALVTVAPGLTTLTAPATVQLTANVTDGAGAAITGVPLSWTSSDITLATVTSSGLVTALSKRGTARITATTLGGLPGDAQVNVILPPSQIRVVSGGTQAGAAGTPLPQPFVVEVLAVDGVPVPGVTVVFNAGTSGATFTPASAVTDAAGRASASITLGTVAGPQTFTAAAGTLSAPATATAAPGPAFRITIAGGDAQSALTGTALPQQLAARVADQFNNPVAATAVAWTRVSGAGTVGAAATQTDATGVARITYTFGVQPGTETINAVHALAGLVTFTETALARPPSSVATASPATQSGTVFTPTQPMTVIVTDALGRGVPNVVTTWVATGGTTLSAPSSITDANGRASINGAFSTTAGISTVTASVAGAGSAQFTLTATAGAATQLLIAAGQGQVAPAGATLPTAPSVFVRDAFDNPVAGATVAFSVLSGGGSVTGGTVVTGVLGTATVGSWTLGPTGGLQTLRAASGLLQVVFNATATGGGPLSVVIISGDAQTAFAGTALAAPMLVEVRDTASTPIPGINVQFTVTGGGATPSGLVVLTDGSGRASFTPTLGPPGPQTVSACLQVGCVSPVNFSATSIASGTVLFWSGSISSSWTTPANWSPQVVPTSTSDINIYGDVSNSPALTGNVAVNDVTFSGGGFLALSGFQLTVAGNLDATNGAMAGGTVRMTGAAASLQGNVASLLVDASAVVTVNNLSTVTGSLTIQNSATLNTAFSFMTVSGSLFVLTNGRLLMTDSDAGLTVQGDATFSARNMGNADLTAGTLQVSGNFTASGFAQAFRATGSHLTHFAGSAAQAISIAFPSSAESQFQNIEVTNASGSGASLSSSVFAAGSASQDGRVTIGSPFIWTVTGALTLGGASTTLATGTVTAGSCTAAPGAIYSGFSCSGAGPVATWLGVTTNWNTASNWSTGLVPLPATDVLIPAGTPNNVLLTGGVAMNGLTVASGATVNTAGFQLQVGASISTTGATFTGGGSILSTAVSSSLSGSVPALFIIGNLTLAGATTVSGNVEISSGGVLDIGTSTMTINGNLDLLAVSNLKMTSAAATLIVTGNALFNGNDMGDTDLTDGVLEVRGNFTAGSAFPQSFRATGNHLTRLTGTAAQSLTVVNPNVTQSQFQNLDLSNAAGITLNSDIVVVAAVQVLGTTALSGGNTSDILVGGDFSSAAGTSLAGIGEVFMYGGTTYPTISGVMPPILRLSTGTTLLVPAGAPAVASLIITNSTTLDLGANALTVNGTFSLSSAGAHIKMTNAAATLTLVGNAVFNGGNMGSVDLTAGLIDVKGNFTAGGTNGFEAFRATGTHTTRFSGAGAQSITFAIAGVSSSTFFNFANTNLSASGVTLSASNAFINGNADQNGRLTIASPRSFNIAGTLTLRAASITTVTATGTIPYGACVNQGGSFSGFVCP
jgi:adhesin/invasin